MLVIGVAIAAPVGAMAILSIQRTLARGWRAGFATGGGIAAADAVFAAVAAFGVAVVAEWLIDYQAPLRIIGGLGLLWLGWRAVRTSSVHTERLDASPRVGYLRQFSTAFGLTLTNPLTIMAFAAVFAGAGLVAQPGLDSAIAVTLGIAVGSLLWWVLLVTIVWSIRHTLRPSVMLVINRVSGGVLMFFGIIALLAGLTSFG